MDPVSAFGLAASVVQFIDFTESLLRGTYKLYHSATVTGDSKVNFDLMTVTESLRALNNELILPIQKAPDSKDRSGLEAEISRLSRECSRLADELILKLEKLRVEKQHDLWQSFRKALETKWGIRDIESLEKRLESFRMQISLQINASIRHQVDSLQTVQTSQGRLISSSLQVAQEIRQSLQKQIGQNALWQQEVIDTISANMGPGPHTIWERNALILNHDSDAYKDFQKQFQKAFLGSLKFADMDRRSLGVSDPYPKTFEWIYSPTSDNDAPNFVRFLEGEQRLFWITGKPAAGKSTLIKLISDDPRTTSHLAIWASCDDLLILRFYFWCSGTEMQMSQEGLIRTLLHQALAQYPHLIPALFPDRMEAFIAFGNGTDHDKPLNVLELFEAFKQVVLNIARSKRIFLLIDGLDEFHGDHLQQLNLVELLYKIMSLSSNIKMCVSSRPWNIFADAFHAHPSLKLESFNNPPSFVDAALHYPDIQHYVSSNLSKNLGFVALQRGDPDYAVSLIDNVSTKSSGIFLWVVLVIQSLLEGLTNGERLSDLQKRLNAIPTDLETLFWKILKSVDFERASQLIQIIEASTQSGRRALTAIELSFADEDDPEYVFKLKVSDDDFNKAKLDSKVEMMRRRLNACSKGLLELPKTQDQDPADATVEYLHRTVRDFVRKPDIWSKIREATTESFDPAMRLALSDIACFKTGYLRYKNFEQRSAAFWDSMINSMINIYRHGPPSMPLQVRYLDDVEKSAKIIMASGQISRGLSYEQCPFNSEESNLTVLSFLELSVKLQLSLYVEQKAVLLHRAGRIDILSRLFQMAATEYKISHVKVNKIRANSRLLETFFKLGLSPNQRFRTIMTFGAPTRTIWEFVVAESSGKADIMNAFIRHGADPFIPALDSCQMDPETCELLQATREQARKNGTRWDDVESAGKTISNKWSRFRSSGLRNKKR